MKRHLQCAEHQLSASNLTKYCPCHAKWLACLILVAYETSFTMRGAPAVTRQLHQILRCHAQWPPTIWQKHAQNSWNHVQRAADPSMIRAWSENDPSMIRELTRQSATRCATEVTFRARDEHFLRKIQHLALRLSFQISPSNAPVTSPSTYFTIPISWRVLLLDDSCYLTTPITPMPWRFLLLDESFYLTTPITWRLLLLDDSFYLTTPITWRLLLITWRFLLLNDSSYLTTAIWRLLLLGDSLYLKTAITWRYLLLDDSYYLAIPFTWRLLLLDDNYYLTTPITWRCLFLDDTYYLTIPITWRNLLLDDSLNYLTTPISWRYLLFDDTYYYCAMSFVYRKSLNLNFLWLCVAEC